MIAPQLPSVLNDITGTVISCAFEVSNGIGCGFRERVYERALEVELRYRRLHVERQRKIPLRFRDQLVGYYIPDIVVNRELLVELKSLPRLLPIHSAQCLNYLRASNLRLCLLLNFGTPRVEIKRFTL